MLRKSILLGLVSLLLLGGLAACGDAPTDTPVPPTATPVPTPVPTVTPVPPTAAPAPTSSFSLATTAASSASSATSAPPLVPPPPGASPVTVDTSAVGLLLQAAGVPAGTSNTLQINIYASNDDPDTLAANYSKTLQAANFAPLSIIPGLGSNMLNKQGQQYIGLLTKGDTQALVALQPYTDDFVKQLSSMGIPADVLKSVTDQVTGKKTVAISVSGTGLLQAFAGAFLSGGGGQATPTPTK